HPARGRGGAGCRFARVALRLVGAARHRIARLVIELAATISPLPGGLARPTIPFGRGVRETACLLGQLAAQLRPRLRREQHAEAGAEHRAGEQPDHETAAAAALILEPIVSVSHFRLLLVWWVRWVW